MNYKKINTFKILNLLIMIIFLCTLFSLFIFRQNILFNLGNKFFGNKQMDKKLYNIDYAQIFFELANESSANKIKWVNYQLSRIHFIKGDFEKSIKYADVELENFPDNCRTNYIRGLAYAYSNDVDTAILNFERFNICFPNTWAGHNDLAWLWFRKGDMQKTISVVEGIVSIYDYNPWLQNTYGVALMNIGKKEEALQSFKKAKQSTSMMTEEDWGNAYPGNDPMIYNIGLKEMKKNIEENINILENKK